MSTATETRTAATAQDAPVKRKWPKQKGARVDIRTTNEARDIIEHAAALQGLTVSEYAKAILMDHARQVIERHEMRRLSDRDRDLFLNLIDSPPAPTEALRAAAADFRRAVESGALIP